MKLSLLLMGLILFSLPIVIAAPGSVWTTNSDCGIENQNVNQYFVGDEVYINGENFNSGNYNWEIKGQPGQASCDSNSIVANGSISINNSGKFCFSAYTIENDDCGEYKAKVGNVGKKDNYRVIENVPVIPEFGFWIGGLTVIGAVGMFFLIRRK